MVRSYGDGRYYKRSGSDTRQMDEREIAEAYERQRLQRIRVGEVEQSIWMGVPPGPPEYREELLFAARYLLIPHRASPTPVSPPSGARDHHSQVLNWIVSPRGRETRFRWEFKEVTISDETEVPHWFPNELWAVHSDGDIVMWDDAIFSGGVPTGATRPEWLWAWGLEAMRLRAFLTLAAASYKASRFDSPLTLIIEPAVLGGDLRERFRQGDTIAIPESTGRWRWTSGPPPLRYHPDIWRVELETDTTEVADPSALGPRVFDGLCRFYGLDTMPDGMATEIGEYFPSG